MTDNRTGGLELMCSLFNDYSCIANSALVGDASLSKTTCHLASLPLLSGENGGNGSSSFPSQSDSSPVPGDVECMCRCLVLSHVGAGVEHASSHQEGQGETGCRWLSPPGSTRARKCR